LFEFDSYDKTVVSAFVSNAFIDLSNHFGDLDQLNLISTEITKEDIKNFKLILKLAFEHIGKSCNDEFIRNLNSNYIKVIDKDRIKFKLGNSSIIYSIEDIFIRFFKYLEKSISRRTCKPVNT
jgi:hypothetical protein